ncbi:MATE family efflux transporter [Jannaschia seohaensis]|uniref:MATE family multidrug resistance protein n=1 Tax=Jannaschia seohaensis TaxID=475081 RepID=A0A2Y9ANB6_9RHOB|nr:MATE family efflux transporter [Jannaschia seohaensis]PWJ19299.1 MATE family multidrug resistance protein [Jannaschia seohaensis]SSA45961.1 multidrug resistance protein, MATE family [Jannaschia seohaensis]
MSEVSHRRVLRIAIPVVLSNATIPLLGAVDTGVVGQMGEAVPIAAVGIGAIALTSIYWIFGFLRMGTTGMTAQAIGAGDEAETVALLSRALLIAGVAGAGLIGLQSALFAGAFALSPATPAVEASARDYMSIRIWSAPAAIAVYGITGWLIAAERTGAVLALQLVMNGGNMALSLWLGLGLGWGVTGVAWATFASEWVGAGLGLWLCRGALRVPAWRDPARVFDAVRLKRMMAVNGDILIRSVLLQATFLSFVFVGARFGTATLAANQVLLQFIYIMAYALDGFAFAAEALVGQAFGARARARLRRAVVVTGIWGAGMAAGLAAGYALGGVALIETLATDPEVRAAAAAFLPWAVLGPLVGVWSFMLDGIFIGATRTRDMRNMMAVSFAVYVGAALVLVPWLGNHGLWAALTISFLARAATLGLRYPALEAAAEAGGPAPRAPRDI